MHTPAAEAEVTVKQRSDSSWIKRRTDEETNRYGVY